MIRRRILFFFFCMFFYTGYARDSIRISRIEYERNSNCVNVTLDNFTSYVLWIYPHSLDIIDSFIVQNKDFDNGMYMDFCFKDKQGMKIVAARAWFCKATGGIILFPFDKRRDIQYSTFEGCMGRVPEQAHSLEIELHVKLFRINIPETREIPFYEQVVHRTIELFDR